MAWLFGIGTTVIAIAIIQFVSVAVGPAASVAASCITMLAFALFAGYDSAKIEFEKYGGLLGRQKPWAITLGCVFLFFVFFALYMTKRWQITHQEVRMLPEFLGVPEIGSHSALEQKN